MCRRLPLRALPARALLLLVACAVGLLAQRAQGCYPQAKSGGGPARLERDDAVYACLVVSPADWTARNTTRYMRQVFELKVDEWSHLQVKDAWESPDIQQDMLGQTLNASDSVAVHLEVGGELSFQKVYRLEDLTFGIMEATVVLERGKVTGVVWDDGCRLCRGSCARNVVDFDGEEDDSARERTCYFKSNECIDSKGKISEICQLNVFVSWQGRDDKGEFLSSGQHRFSRLPRSSTRKYGEDIRDNYK